MTKKISKSQLAALQKERETTLAELTNLENELRSEVEFDDVDDMASDLIEREKTQSLINNLKLKLKNIDHAIEQAEEIGYGVCEKCGTEIDPERLEIFPETTLCIECKRAEERRFRANSPEPKRNRSF